MPRELLLRPATRSDVRALHRLTGRGYRAVQIRYGIAEERITAEELTAIVDDLAQVLLAAEREGELAACVQVSALGGGLCSLELLCVDPPLQGKGLGTWLLAAAEREAARFGASRMEMVVIERSAELVAFYGRRGYAPTGEKRPLPLEGIDLSLIVLAKDIAPARS